MYMNSDSGVKSNHPHRCANRVYTKFPIKSSVVCVCVASSSTFGATEFGGVS